MAGSCGVTYATYLKPFCFMQSALAASICTSLPSAVEPGEGAALSVAPPQPESVASASRAVAVTVNLVSMAASSSSWRETILRLT